MLSFLIYLFCFLVFLFSLYLLCRDDFILLRRNVSLDNVFNLAFITVGVGLFFARLFHVVFNFEPRFLNPLTFLLFTHFPGLSLAGGILGAFLFMIVFFRAYKVPIAHLLDFFLLSFFAVLPFGFLLHFFLTKKDSLIFPLEALVFAILLVVLIGVFQKVKMEEGSIGFLSLVSFSFLSLVFKIIENWRTFSFFSGETVLLMAIFLISLSIFARQEKILSRLLHFCFYRAKL